jgi:hypothetical protein
LTDFRAAAGIIGNAIWLQALLLMLRAFVAMCLWRWYAAPVFHVTRVSLPQAFGLLLLVRIVTGKPGQRISNSEAVWQTTVTCVVLLIFGWFGSWFV